MTLGPEKQERPPGWYDDGSGHQRYWNGTQWAVWLTPPKPTAAPREKEQRATALIIVGYILAVLFPLAGFVIGLTQVSRNVHGIRIVWVAVAVFALGLVLVAAGV
jgi:hypothetical protein